VKRHLIAAVLLASAVLGLAAGDNLGPAAALADSPPTVSIDPPSGVTSSSASLSGTVNPNGGPSATSWHFEYAAAAEPENWIAAGGGEITGTEAEESTPVVVATTLQGLNPSTEYLVRLVAANEGGGNVVASEAPFPTFTTDAVAPAVRSLPAFPLAGGTTALLGGAVNPKGSPATYRLEYGTTAGYGSSAPVGQGDAGAGDEAAVFAERVGGLAPDTLYHFRIVAQNALGTFPGEDLTFRTAPAGAAASGSCPNASLRAQQHAAFLPDCRAYEMVSPVDKNGADVAPGGGIGITASAQSSGSGDALAYVSSGIFAEPLAGAAPGFYLGSRGAANWSSVQAAVPQQPHQGLGYASPVVAMSSDLSREIVRSRDPLLPGTPQKAGVPNVFLRDNRDGSLKLVTTTLSPLTVGRQTQFIEASADFSHVLFATTAALTPEAPAGVPNLYEWIDGPTPETRLVSVLPGSEGPSPVGALAAIWENGPATTAGQGRNAISSDGSRILFVTDSGAAPTSFPVGQIYLRQDGQTTTRISASQRSVADPNGAKPATFGAATPDQAFVYFTSGEKLTDDATTGSTSDGSDLYRYETATGELTDLTVDANPQDPNGAQVESALQASGVLAVSNDGSHVYFMARGNLAPGGVSGAENLYVWHDGTIDHVLTGTIGKNGTSRALATISPSGRYLAFTSSDRLTAYPNAGHQEVYLYDAGAGRLDCASCDPDGATPTTDAVLQEQFNLGSLASQARRYVLDDGSVFFDTAESLVGADSNGVADAYRYLNGRVSLISTGRGEYAASFYDASGSGDDVFFSTREALVSQDVDDLMDAYDARSGGGLAAQNPLPPPPPCVGEACRESAPSSPGAALPASSTVAAPAAAKPRRPHQARKRKGKKHKRHQKKRGRHAKSRHAQHPTAKHG
jgi:hypothetical protein